MNLEYKKLKWHAVLKLSQQTIKYLEEENSTHFKPISDTLRNLFKFVLISELFGLC
ncbi:hypothetical protein [Vibrio campbellii]|uniref:hypothetical protein n=1 Tax=Vibrio campbellii TaxID=680 RepID=UPI00210D9FEF|nr:hypothetical protein [Vibrio campbellii]UTZ42771.1 hypothetical protein HB764_22720 [Vibrio campbellii]